MASRGGAARAVRGGGKQVQELHGALRKLFSGFNWVEEGRRRGLRGGLWRIGGHGTGGGALDGGKELGWTSWAREGRVEGRGCGWEQMKEGRARAGEEHGVAAGQRTAASFGARRGSGPFKTSQGRRGRRVGVSVARGIEGRPRSAARAGAWPGSFGATAASRRVAERSSCVACSSTEQKVRSVAGSTGWEGKSAGVQARHSWPGSEQACAKLRCSARRSSARVKEEREETEREERESTDV